MDIEKSKHKETTFYPISYCNMKGKNNNIISRSKATLGIKIIKEKKRKEEKSNENLNNIIDEFRKLTQNVCKMYTKRCLLE